MLKSELKKFASMVCLYNEVGNVKVWEQEMIETVVKLNDANNLDAIDTLCNEDKEFTTADEMMLEHFGEDTASLNLLAVEFGFSKIA